MKTAKKAFTLIELLVVIAIIALLIAILLPALGKARASARQLKDATHLRGVMQGLVLFAQNNGDTYPLPSNLDRANTTVPTLTGQAKDLPRHIMSVMIFNGFFPTDMMVSPAESNGSIRPYEGYEFTNPSIAGGAPGGGTANQALWDPKFVCLPSGGTNGDSTIRLTSWPNNGSCSYAITPPFGSRLNRWSNTFNATEAVIGNRGPIYTLDGTGQWRLAAAGTGGAGAGGGIGSNTLLIHGSRTTWEGNLGFNDNHVDYVTKPDPDNVTFNFNQAVTYNGQNVRTVPDNVFMNESDDNRTVSTNLDQANAILKTWGSCTVTNTGGTVSIQVNFWQD